MSITLNCAIRTCNRFSKNKYWIYSKHHFWHDLTGEADINKTDGFSFVLDSGSAVVVLLWDRLTSIQNCNLIFFLPLLFSRCYRLFIKVVLQMSRVISSQTTNRRNTDSQRTKRYLMNANYRSCGNADLRCPVKMTVASAPTRRFILHPSFLINRWQISCSDTAAWLYTR